MIFFFILILMHSNRNKYDFLVNLNVVGFDLFVVFFVVMPPSLIQLVEQDIVQDAMSLVGAVPAAKLVPQIGQPGVASSDQLGPAIRVVVVTIVVVIAVAVAARQTGLAALMLHSVDRFSINSSHTHTRDQANTNTTK